MARIRTIKPEFFRHEGLQDLEIANPGKYPMMVFEGLWGHCDSKGRFEWRPRQLKLDILPFLPFDMADTLGILERSGMVNHYVIDGKEYGEIPSFEKHQRLSGKELTEGEKHPEPNGEATGKHQGSTGEIQESQEGKGRERNNAPDKPVDFNPTSFLLNLEVTEPVVRDFLKIRKTKRAPPTETALTGIVKEASKAGITLQEALETCCKRGWQGFEAKWLDSGGKQPPAQSIMAGAV